MKNVEPHEFTSPPYDYNYNILGLSKVRDFKKGELNKIDYYGYVDSGGTYHDKILTEYRDYYRKDRLVYMRKLIINWYLVDGTIGGTKTTFKYYSPEESLKLGERRRRNIISDLKINTIKFIRMIKGVNQLVATTEGIKFLSNLTNEVTEFVEGIENPLKELLLTYHNSEFDWLDEIIPDGNNMTVREYMYNVTDIDYTDKIYGE